MDSRSDRQQHQQAPVAVSERDGCTWAVLPDALTMDSYAQVEERLTDLLAEKPVRMVIDLGQTRNMYSAGFGMIVRVKKLAEARGKDVCLVNVNSRVAEALEAVGLHKVLSVYEEGETPDLRPSA